MYTVVHFVLFPSGQERFFYEVNMFFFALGAVSVYRLRNWSVAFTYSLIDWATSTSGSFEQAT